ncbi:MAG: EscU/YscU/HrcU family type III secretion system export apparatus switch protein [Rhodobacteraceae bacterium]|jgi:flagellar biosynthesis protein FlhB|nr:EscU/YscU/HrcU family type III secretion system export apparatus switch protein [Paracoccaceae bacterium]
MSDDKTEEPTDKKLEDARKKGQVPQRKNVLEAAVLTTGVMLIMSLWPNFAAGTSRVVDIALLGITDGVAGVRGQLIEAVTDIAILLLAIAGATGFLVLFLNLLLNRFNFAPAAMEPKFEKLNPINGLKGIFSKNTLYMFGRLMVFFPIVSILLYVMVESNMVDVIYASACGLTCLAEIFPDLTRQMVMIILIVLIILAALDFKIQDALFRSQNKMTKDEVKREYKGAEGDPLIKGQRRSIAEEDAVMPGPKDVTHVVFGSNHLVAMLYVPGQTPFVVMKGKGPAVARMQQRFRSLGAACVNIPAVAQEFHKKYPVGQYMDAAAAKGMGKVLRATGEMG